jgi:hypothetical protein
MNKTEYVLACVAISITYGIFLMQHANGYIDPSQYNLTERFVKQSGEFMKEPITNDSQRVESITEQEYNNRIAELNKLLESRGQEPIILPYKESCYNHEDDKYLYETMQCIK